MERCEGQCALQVQDKSGDTFCVLSRYPGLGSHPDIEAWMRHYPTLLEPISVSSSHLGSSRLRSACKREHAPIVAELWLCTLHPISSLVFSGATLRPLRRLSLKHYAADLAHEQRHSFLSGSHNRILYFSFDSGTENVTKWH